MAESFPEVNLVALAGGVGGARLADGLAQIVPPARLTIIVNTGDDFKHLGLYICPDLDTVCYTLAGVANPATGWGRANETWKALETLGALGGPTWFRLGDGDLGLHLERTRLLKSGQSLSTITEQFCHALGVIPVVMPMSDDPVPTLVNTDEGELHFQEYFVRRQCRPRVTGVHFKRAEKARPAPGVIQALVNADLVVICPSNPWLSIDPILATPGIRQALAALPVLAVSPIIKGQTVKGPAAKICAELGIPPNAVSVARHYGELLTGFVLDSQDAELEKDVHALGIETLVTDTLMKNPQDRTRLAEEVVAFGVDLIERMNRK